MITSIKMTAKVKGFLSWKGWALIFRGRHTRALVIAMVLKQRQFELVVMYCPKSHSKSCLFFFVLLSSRNSCWFWCQRWCDIRFIYDCFHVATVWVRTKVPAHCLQQQLIWRRCEPDGERKQHKEEENPPNQCCIITKQVKRSLLFLSQWTL